MSLNGDFYDRQLAQLRDLRNLMIEARVRCDPHAVVSNADRGKVGLMIGKLEKTLLASCCLDEWEGDVRKARLWLMSQLCNRPIRSAYTMRVYEVKGWLEWAIIWGPSHVGPDYKYIENYPGLKLAAWLAMKALIEDENFRMLAMALPRIGAM